MGGGIGWLSELERARRIETVHHVGGIMNGTCNYILDSMTRLGLGYSEALKQAQALGYAEADPTTDVEGIDTWHKLIVSANIGFGVSLDISGIPAAGISRIGAEDVANFSANGLVCKLVSTADCQSGNYSAYVQPTLYPLGQPEAAVPANYNLITLEGDVSGRQSFFGQGAGRYPTAYNVVPGLRGLLPGQGLLHHPRAEGDGRQQREAALLCPHGPGGPLVEGKHGKALGRCRGDQTCRGQRHAPVAEGPPGCLYGGVCLKEGNNMKVVKFGGSSMADAGQYRKIRDILLADPERKVVVVSAAGKRNKQDHKITDLLYLCYAHTQYGVDCSGVFEMITSRYREIARDLNLSIDLEPEFADLKAKLDNKTVTQDELASRGEYFSARLMADYLGFKFVDAADWVKFRFDGTVDQESSYEALRNQVDGIGVVIPGFYGQLPDGKIKTFTRGGSDITGALAAAALDADVYENWTDVSGILMADPRIVDNPQTIPEVTYDELRELSYSGAQVLHEGTIFPVREKNIPLNIRNTNAPEDPGTMIQERFEGNSDPHRFITGITGKKDFTIIALTKRGMSNQVGVLRKVLTVLERHDISVDYVPNGIDNVSVVVPTEAIASSLYTILGEIQKEVEPDSLTVHDQIAVVAAVGRKMAFRPGVSGQIFAVLGQAGINIRMINQGPDELNIIFGVDNRDFSEAIRVLYNSFVK